MSKISLNKLNLTMPEMPPKIIKLNDDVSFELTTYLPQAKKAELMEWVLNNAIDTTTYTFNPIVLETYFSIALVKFYTNITFTAKQEENIPKLYDLLECNDIFNLICGYLPDKEYNYLKQTIEEISKDMSRYYQSFAGMMTTISNNTDKIDNQLNSLIEKIKNKEGIKEIVEIKEAIG